MSLPASKGFEIGSGFGSVLMTGREHNDAFVRDPTDSLGPRPTVRVASRAASPTARTS